MKMKGGHIGGTDVKLFKGTDMETIVGHNCGNFKGHGSENYGCDSKVDFLKKKINFKKKKIIFFILFFFFFWGGGGAYLCKLFGGHGPPVPPYSYGPVK